MRPLKASPTDADVHAIAQQPSLHRPSPTLTQEIRMVRPRRPLGRALLALPLAACLAAVALLRPAPVRAAANQFCSGEYLAVGANWSLCWEIRANEGLSITHAFFTVPQSGFDRRVLSDATVAQVFVPYEVGQPRYHDVAYGLGAAMQRLNGQIDCPHGQLLAGGKVCRELEDRGLSQRYCLEGNCSAKRGKALVLWSSIQTGAYNYLQRWEFRDDGSIHPAMGLAGALQFGNVAHTHNVYWRMDFDMGDPEHDRVEEFVRLPKSGSNGLAGVSTWNQLLGETYRPTELFTFRKWRISDTQQKNALGKPWSYEIVPSPGDGSLRTNPNEGFLRGEFWVTRAHSNERFVSTDQADLLSTYLNGEAVDDQDLVAWYALHAYHEIRSEDQPYMPVEWVGFEARPRDFFDKNPMN